MQKIILNSLSVLFLLILIPFIYINYVIIEYDYWFSTNEHTVKTLFIFYLIPIVLALIAKDRISKPSDFLCWLYFFLICIPTVSLSPYLANSFETGTTAIFIVCTTTLHLISIGYINETKIIPYIKGLNSVTMLIIISLLILLLTSVLIYNYNFNISKILDLSIFKDAYIIRDEFRNAKSDSSALASYSIFWLAKVLLPFFICYGLAFRKKIFLIIGVVLQILVFSISAHKSFVFSILLIFIIYYLITRRFTLYQWALGLLSVTFASLILQRFFNQTFLIDVVIRRSLIVPGVLSQWWVNYFDNNEYVYFSNSLLGNLFNSNYNNGAPFVIGKYYFGSEWTSANTNFAIDAFGNGGWLTLLIFIIILTFILLTINKFSSGSESKKLFIILFTVPTFWSLIETSFVSVLITHGLFLCFFIIILFRKD